MRIFSLPTGHVSCAFQNAHLSLANYVHTISCVISIRTGEGEANQPDRGRFETIPGPWIPVPGHWIPAQRGAAAPPGTTLNSHSFPKAYCFIGPGPRSRPLAPGPGHWSPVPAIGPVLAGFTAVQLPERDYLLMIGPIPGKRGARSPVPAGLGW